MGGRPESEEEELEVLEKQEELDYEELLQSKCITYSDDTLGARARGKKKRDRKVEEGLNKEKEILEKQWGAGLAAKEEDDGGW